MKVSIVFIYFDETTLIGCLQKNRFNKKEDSNFFGIWNLENYI
jgi:hypothetical protein